MNFIDYCWPTGEEFHHIRVARAEPHRMVFQEIEFHFNSQAVKLSVNAETDEIAVTLNSPEPLKDELCILERFLGRRLVYVWRLTNNQGYSDVVLFGIEFAVPTFGVVSIASSLKIFECEPIVADR